MRTQALVLFLCLAACTPDEPSAPPPDAEPPPSIEEIVLADYENDAYMFELDNGLPLGWADWMIERKARFAGAYVRARIDRRIRVEVRYDVPIAYDPPWTDEDEHMRALERMAELAYVGWDFSFSLDDPDRTLQALAETRPVRVRMLTRYGVSIEAAG